LTSLTHGYKLVKYYLQRYKVKYPIQDNETMYIKSVMLNLLSQKLLYIIQN